MRAWYADRQTLISRGLLEDIWDLGSSVEDADELNALFDGPLEVCISPYLEKPEIRGILPRTRSDPRMFRVEVAPVIKVAREPVRGVCALAFEILENLRFFVSDSSFRLTGTSTVEGAGDVR